MTFSQIARQKDARELPMSTDRVAKVGVALDLERYDPKGPFRDMREVLNIAQDDVIIGMVARFQKYRRTEVFLRALGELVSEFPHAKALLVGRSSQIQESVIEPTKRLGLSSHVILAGYQKENYLDTLAIMDIFVFLVAGSDGTARALREAMALGKPAVVARKGILPELVEDGRTGFVVDDDPKRISSALRTLIESQPLRGQMGQMARRKALREFRLEKQTEEVEAFYRKISEMGPRIQFGERPEV
jgi:glycosyltransferase involved in cell wall biosynthesis